MRIPFWQRGQAHPTKAIDRMQGSYSSRQIIGLAIDTQHATTASLVRCKGQGKYSRFEEVASVTLNIEEATQGLLAEILGDESPSTEGDVQFVTSELTNFLAEACRQLLTTSGVHANEVTAIGVLDLEYQFHDFEGKRGFRSLVNAAELASKTLITVIDRFAERDRIDGGNGQHLTALGNWFLFGDRNSRIAEENRLLCLSEKQSYFLPASDGLDAVLPEIRYLNFDSEAQRIGNESQQEPRVKELFEAEGLQFRIVAESTSLAKQISSVLGLDGNKETLLSAWEEFGIRNLSSVSAAFLANAFIDQLPVSLPDLTGNLNPRVLGQLTPGSLANFRNYVLQASKVTPSIMKLKDAI